MLTSARILAFPSGASFWRLLLATTLAVGLAGCAKVQEKYGSKSARMPATLQPQPPVLDDMRSRARPAAASTAPNQGTRQSSLPQTEYYPGVQPAYRPTATAYATGQDEGSITLNFVDAPIKDLVDVVLADALGLNYVVDSRVQGSVTVRTSSPIPRRDAFSVLENLLAVNGAALTPIQGGYAVVPLEAARAAPNVVVAPQSRGVSRGVGAHVIPVRYAGVQSLHDVAAKLVSPGNQLAMDPARNLLIYVGPAVEADAIKDLVATLDIDLMRGLSFALTPAVSSDAEDIVRDLEAMFLKAVAGRGLEDTVQFIPIQRLNAILIVSAEPSYLRQLTDWVRRLDRADGAATRRAHVYYVKNGKAQDLVVVLREIFNAGGSSPAGRPSPIAPGLTPARIDAATATQGSAQTQQQAGTQTQTPTQATGAAVGPRPRPLGSRSGSQTNARSGQRGDGIRFVAHEHGNSIVIMATAQEYKQIEAVLRRLDEQPLQVLIEATIAEVVLNDTLEYGLQWAFQQGDLSGIFSSALAGGVAQSFPGFNLVFDSGQVRSVLRALSEITAVDVVSSPQLVVLDNQPARLQVGDQVPVATQSSVSTINPNAPIVNSISYFDTGVILTVTPRVGEGGTITLQTELEVSDAVNTASSAIDSPTIQQRTVRTTVSINSGETVALGGLIRDRASDGTVGIPLLQDIPILGNAFKTTSKTGRRTELLILLTPRVIRGQAESRSITNELRRRMTDLRRGLNTRAR